MKRLAIALLIAATASLAAAQEKPAESALVKASKASTRKKKKPAHVITNADLHAVPSAKHATPKKTPKKAVAEVAAVAVVEPDKPLNDDQLLLARRAAGEKVASAEKHVSDLEHELARVEQDYYEENDPSRRDQSLAKRFEQTKKQLGDARAELTEARDALGKLARKPAS
jgi:hypothetical protein